MNYGSVCSGIEAATVNVLEQRKMELHHLASQVKGSIAEYAVAGRLCELGFSVWMPFVQNTKSDLAVSHGSMMYRIQVKTATYDPRDDRFRAILLTRDSKTRKHVSYGDDDFDFFIVHCPGVEDKYVIPATVGNKYKSANLLPHRNGIRFQRGPLWEQYKNSYELLRGTP